MNHYRLELLKVDFLALKTHHLVLNPDLLALKMHHLVSNLDHLALEMDHLALKADHPEIKAKDHEDLVPLGEIRDHQV